MARLPRHLQTWLRQLRTKTLRAMEQIAEQGQEGHQTRKPRSQLVSEGVSGVGGPTDEKFDWCVSPWSGT